MSTPLSPITSDDSSNRNDREMQVDGEDDVESSPLTAISESSSSSSRPQQPPLHDESSSPSATRTSRDEHAQPRLDRASAPSSSTAIVEGSSSRRTSSRRSAKAPTRFDEDLALASKLAPRRATAHERQRVRQRREKAKEEEVCPICMPKGVVIEQVLTEEQEKENESKVWIQCEEKTCNTWYHWLCVAEKNPDATESLSPDDFDRWYCPSCTAATAETQTPLISTRKPEPRRTPRAAPKLDYNNLNQHLPADHLRFRRVLASRTIQDLNPTKMKPEEMTDQWLYGPDSFKRPFLIEQPEGLGMKMPSTDTTISAIADEIGRDYPIEALDVALQNQDKTIKTLGQWADYFEAPKREKVRNVISLEFGSTPLGKRVDVPEVVRKLDWVERIWPADKKKEEGTYPQVQKYCLMSVAESYTDWHIDFAGSSVFYHILRGGKIFYFIEPTEKNLKAYEHWSGLEDRQEEKWLGDYVDAVYKVELFPGNTMFIPTGWIHAVETPSDSLVIGGNFVHSLDIVNQLEVYRIEIATKVPLKFRFPFFVTLCWYVVNHYLPRINKLSTGKNPAAKARPIELSQRVLVGLKALSEFLIEQTTRWAKGSTKQPKTIKTARDNVPAEHVKNPVKLSRDLRRGVMRALGEEPDRLCDLPKEATSLTWEPPEGTLIAVKGAASSSSAIGASGVKRARSANSSPKKIPVAVNKEPMASTSSLPMCPPTNGEAMPAPSPSPMSTLGQSSGSSTTPASTPALMPILNQPLAPMPVKNGVTPPHGNVATPLIAIDTTPAPPALSSTSKGKRRASEVEKATAVNGEGGADGSSKPKKARLATSGIPVPPQDLEPFSEVKEPYRKTERDEVRIDPGRPEVGERQAHVLESTSTKTTVLRWEENGKVYVHTHRIVQTQERLEFDLAEARSLPPEVEKLSNAELVEAYRQRKSSSSKPSAGPSSNGVANAPASITNGPRFVPQLSPTSTFRAPSSHPAQFGPPSNYQNFATPPPQFQQPFLQNGFHQNGTFPTQPQHHNQSFFYPRPPQPPPPSAPMAGSSLMPQQQLHQRHQAQQHGFQHQPQPYHPQPVIPTQPRALASRAPAPLGPPQQLQQSLVPMVSNSGHGNPAPPPPAPAPDSVPNAASSSTQPRASSHPSSTSPLPPPQASAQSPQQPRRTSNTAPAPVPAPASALPPSMPALMRPSVGNAVPIPKGSRAGSEIKLPAPRKKASKGANSASPPAPAHTSIPGPAAHLKTEVSPPTLAAIIGRNQANLLKSAPGLPA